MRKFILISIVCLAASFLLTAAQYGGDKSNTIPASGPVTLFSDSFTGTAGTALNSYNADYVNWFSNNYYDCHISTPNGGVAASSTPCADYITGYSWTTNMWIQMTLAKVPSSSALICINASSPYTTSLTAYCAGPDPNLSSTEYFLIKYTTGTETNLGTYSQTPAPGDVIKLQNNAGSLSLIVNGTTIITASDSSFTGGNPGMIIEDSSGTNAILSTLTAGHL